MNREIKFRIWDIEDNKMVDGFNFDCITYFDNSGRLFCSDGFELMQFTGLCDKKRTAEYPEGQEIYEGDWLEHYATCGYVVSEDGMFSLSSSARANFGYRQPLAYINTHETIVIGNIHENPELLEVGNDELFQK